MYIQRFKSSEELFVYECNMLKEKSHPGWRDFDLFEKLDQKLCDVFPRENAVGAIEHDDDVHVLLTF